MKKQTKLTKEHKLVAKALGTKEGRSIVMQAVLDLVNPEGLTEWGQEQGYRLLNKDELVPQNSGKTIYGLEYHLQGDKWKPHSKGDSVKITYRTKLTPAKLKELRQA
jgi:hypothetical protein